MLFRCSTPQNDPRRRLREGNESKQVIFFWPNDKVKAVFWNLFKKNGRPVTDFVDDRIPRRRGTTSSSKQVPISLFFPLSKTTLSDHFKPNIQQMKSTSMNEIYRVITDFYGKFSTWHQIEIRWIKWREKKERRNADQWRAVIYGSPTILKRKELNDAIHRTIQGRSAHARWEIPFVCWYCTHQKCIQRSVMRSMPYLNIKGFDITTSQEIQSRVMIFYPVQQRTSDRPCRVRS